MLVTLLQEQLDSIAPIDENGVITADTEALAIILAESIGVDDVMVAISSIDYDQHEDGTPEPNTRTVKGICWQSLEHDDLCHKWSFRSDGRALSITDEKEQPCPISENADLIARAIIAIADSHPDTVIDERNNRLTIPLPNGEMKKVRVVVTQDPRVMRPEDVVEGLELIAYQAGTLGVVMVMPNKDGQALVRKIGFN
jgi:hypothetical protein